MAFIKLPKEFHIDFRIPGMKPVGPVEIDYTNPLSRSLDAFMLFDGYEATNLVAPNRFKFGSSYKGIDDLKGGAKGLEAHITALTTTGEVYRIVPMRSFNQGTAIFSGCFENYTGAAGFFSLRTVDTAPNTIFFRLDNNSIRVRINGSTIVLDSPVDVFGSTTSVVKTITWNEDTNTRSLYIDGAFADSDGTAFSWVDQVPNEYSLYGDNSAGGNVANSWQRYAMTFDRELTEGEVASLYRDPYQLLRPLAQSVYITSDAPPPSGRIMSSLAHNGGLAGLGGIAGPGGGLAG